MDLCVDAMVWAASTQSKAARCSALSTRNERKWSRIKMGGPDEDDERGQGVRRMDGAAQ